MTTEEFEYFMESYERDVFTFCKYLASDHHTACDLYQETALAAFEMRGRIDLAQNPKSFLFAIAAGKWKNMRKKAMRRQKIAPQHQLEEWTNASVTGHNPTADMVQDAMMQDALRSAIAGIDDKFRIPLILHYFDDCPMDTIATICGIPVGTVKSRLHKARALLEKTLKTEGVSHA